MIGSNAVLLPLLTDRTRRRERERESWGLEVDENRFSRPLHLRYQSARKRERDIPLLPPMPFYMEMWNKDDGEKRKKKLSWLFRGGFSESSSFRVFSSPPPFCIHLFLCFVATHYPPAVTSPGNQSLYWPIHQYVYSDKKRRVGEVMYCASCLTAAIFSSSSSSRGTMGRVWRQQEEWREEDSGARRQRSNQLKASTLPREKLATNEHRLGSSSPR